MSWRDNLRPASFRGAAFYVEANARMGGRRGFTYEFAKSDTSKDEDLGKRVARATVSAYILGDDYNAQADKLEDALNREGGGALILPILGQMTMRCEGYSRAERRDLGGMATFEMAFVLAGGSTPAPASDDTQAGVQTQATATADAAELSAGKDSDWV